ncbi:MAG: cytochrome c3 family protein [Desulfobacterales bacterium]
MRKTLGLIFSVTLMATLFVGISAYCQDYITFVSDGGFSERTRPAVPFVHDEHNEMADIEECNQCHHVWEDGEIVDWDSSEDRECSECHLSDDSDHTTMDLIKAYHDLCKGCHMEQKAGPVQCSECHVKQ